MQGTRTLARKCSSAERMGGRVPVRPAEVLGADSLYSAVVSVPASAPISRPRWDFAHRAVTMAPRNGALTMHVACDDDPSSAQLPVSLFSQSPLLSKEGGFPGWFHLS